MPRQPQRPPGHFGCASRSRTYDGGVKVPCLTAWRWRIVQLSIAYFLPFHKRHLAFLHLFSCSVGCICGCFCIFHFLPCFFKRQVLKNVIFKKYCLSGCKTHLAEVNNIFFSQNLYFLLRFWYTGCDSIRLKKLLRCPGCVRVGQCLHLCEGKRGIS